MRKETWKNADYPNAIPSWRKHPCKFKPKLTQAERVFSKMTQEDWDKLATIGKEEV